MTSKPPQTSLSLLYLDNIISSAKRSKLLTCPFKMGTSLEAVLKKWPTNNIEETWKDKTINYPEKGLVLTFMDNELYYIGMDQKFPLQLHDIIKRFGDPDEKQDYTDEATSLFYDILNAKYELEFKKNRDNEIIRVSLNRHFYDSSSGENESDNELFTSHLDLKQLEIEDLLE